MPVCNWSGYNARSFIRFTAFPDTEVTVERVLLYLCVSRREGAWDGAILDLHTLVDTLEQTELYWGEMPGISDEPVASFTVPPEPTCSIFVDVTEAATSWIKEEVSNYGFALKAHDEAGPEFLLEFVTRHVSVKEIDDSTSLDLRPALRIDYLDEEEEEQLAISIAAQDVFADTLLTPFPADDLRLLCGNGFPSRAFLRFDLGDIPEGATVTRSIMSVVIDGATSSFDSLGVKCHAVLEWPWEEFDTSIGATGIETITIMVEDTETDSILDMDITDLVQPLVAREEAHSGFVIKGSNETFDLDFVRLWSHTQPDTSLRPRLVVDYILPPTSPYPEAEQP